MPALCSRLQRGGPCPVAEAPPHGPPHTNRGAACGGSASLRHRFVHTVNGEGYLSAVSRPSGSFGGLE
ncbi:hypothetical protein C8Q78DRAFT_197894 [Trametes maxima]|nr:hypothetical protein C8Q78DRAFT_197894 [Trametes maxima]